MSHTFPIRRRIAESTLKLINDTRSKIFGNEIFERRYLTTYNLQRLHIFLNGISNLVLVCKDIEPRSKTRSFFSNVKVVFLSTCMLSMNFATFIYKIFRVAIS